MLVALIAQALLPHLIGGRVWFDFPLVITIYFALARRSPIGGMLLGGVMGIFQDALTGHAIGIYGIAKTISGFLAASIGVRIDVQNTIIRVMLNFGLTVLCTAIYLFIYRFLLGMEFSWNWPNTIIQAIFNSVLALFVFPLLDRFQVKD
jgi:rod shape-determining protein MreD